MTKDKALHAWFSQFLPAYPASSVPGDAVFPWLTYDLILGAWDSGEASITVNLWYYTESEAPQMQRHRRLRTLLEWEAFLFLATRARFG